MIRRYRAADWTEVCRIYDAAKPIELLSGGVPHSFCSLEDDAPRKDEFSASIIFVWAEEGTIHGFTGYRNDTIGWLFVDPRNFRKGIGRSLLQHVLSAIEGEPILWTMEWNQAAITLYRSLGFEVIEKRDTHNRGFPCSAIKMKKTKQSNHSSKE